MSGQIEQKMYNQINRNQYINLNEDDYKQDFIQNENTSYEIQSNKLDLPQIQINQIKMLNEDSNLDIYNNQLQSQLSKIQNENIDSVAHYNQLTNVNSNKEFFIKDSQRSSYSQTYKFKYFKNNVSAYNQRKMNVLPLEIQERGGDFKKDNLFQSQSLQVIDSNYENSNQFKQRSIENGFNSDFKDISIQQDIKQKNQKQFFTNKTSKVINVFNIGSKTPKISYSISQKIQNIKNQSHKPNEKVNFLNFNELILSKRSNLKNKESINNIYNMKKSQSNLNSLVQSYNNQNSQYLDQDFFNLQFINNNIKLEGRKNHTYNSQIFQHKNENIISNESCKNSNNETYQKIINEYEKKTKKENVQKKNMQQYQRFNRQYHNQQLLKQNKIHQLQKSYYNKARNNSIQKLEESDEEMIHSSLIDQNEQLMKIENQQNQLYNLKKSLNQNSQKLSSINSTEYLKYSQLEDQTKKSIQYLDTASIYQDSQPFQQQSVQNLKLFRNQVNNLYFDGYKQQKQNNSVKKIVFLKNMYEHRQNSNYQKSKIEKEETANKPEFNKQKSEATSFSYHLKRILQIQLLKSENSCKQQKTITQNQSKISIMQQSIDKNQSNNERKILSQDGSTNNNLKNKEDNQEIQKENQEIQKEKYQKLMLNYQKNISQQLDKLNQNIDSIINDTHTLVNNKSRDVSKNEFFQKEFQKRKIKKLIYCNQDKETVASEKNDKKQVKFIVQDDNNPQIQINEQTLKKVNKINKDLEIVTKFE